MSPILFLFYIDDLHWDSGDLQDGIFADDVEILAQDSKFHVKEARLRQAPVVVNRWRMDYAVFGPKIRMQLLLDELALIQVATKSSVLMVSLSDTMPYINSLGRHITANLPSLDTLLWLATTLIDRRDLC